MLVPNVAGWSIVITGAWNSRIFTPQWLGNGRVTRSQAIRIEVPIDEPRAPRRILFDDVVLEIQSSRLAVRVTREDDALLRRIQEIALKLLQDLPHTPLTGIGVNFSFSDTEASPALSRIFQFPDTGALTDEEWVTEATKVHRQLRKGAAVLNLILGLDERGAVRFDLNFHSVPRDTAEAMAQISSDIVARKNDSTNLIQQIYYRV